MVALCKKNNSPQYLAYNLQLSQCLTPRPIFNLWIPLKLHTEVESAILRMFTNLTKPTH